MRSRLLLAALLFVAPTIVHAQDAERREVLSVLNRFFDAMIRRDTAVSRAVLLPGSVFYATVEGPKPMTRISSDSAYLHSLATGQQALRERIWEPTVLLRGAVAEVWTPYDFHIDGKFSHCGIDSFTFVKTETGWRMATAVYTVQRDGCPPSPLGELK